MKDLREVLAKMPPDRRRQTLRELPSKLVEAEKVDKLHTLLAEEHEGRNAWFEAKETYAETASYLENIRSAWDQAKKEFNQNPGVAIALQYRYALITTTLNSLSRNIPAPLIAALVEKGLWTAAQGLAYAQQVKKSNQQEYSQQAKVLSALAPHLPQELLQQALDIARSIQDDSERVQALHGLASHFPEVLPEALNAAHSIQDDTFRAIALRELVPHFPEVLPEVLNAVRSIKDNHERIEALCRLAPYSPEAPREAFDSVNDLDTSGIKYRYFNGTSFDSYLNELASYFPDKLLQQALDVTRGFRSGRICASTLKALAPHLSEELLRQALDIARSIQDDSSRALALIGLVSRLPEIRQETLDAARSVKDDSNRAEALSELALHLPEVLSEALNAACSIQDKSSRALALSKLAPYLSEELLQQTLDAASSINFSRFSPDRNQQDFLSGLAPRLSKVQLQQMLDVARGIQDSSDRSDFISILTSYLPKQLLQQALDVARGIQDDPSYAEALSGLVPYLPGILQQALDVARSIQDDYYRAEALSRLILYSSGIIRSGIIREAFDAACEIQEGYALAFALKELAPSLSEELLQKAVDITRGIQDDSYRVEALSVLAPYLSEAPQLMSFIDFFSLNLFGERVSKLTTKSQVLQEALDIACRIQSDHERAESLGKLAPHLSQKMLKQALKAAQIIKDEAQRAIALSKLVPYLLEARPLANDAINGIRQQEAAVRVLSEIASSFSEEALQYILDNIHELFDSSLHLDVLKVLVPLLPKAQQEAALKFVLNIQDYDCYYGVVLEGLVQFLPQPILQQVLDITCGIQDDEERGFTLVRLVPYLPQPMLQQALDAARGLQDDYRAPVFSNLLSVLNLASIEFQLWCEILDNLSYSTRESLLEDIPELSKAMIALGGTQALDGTALAIQKVCRQWR